jgi:hypothetical protein
MVTRILAFRARNHHPEILVFGVVYGVFTGCQVIHLVDGSSIKIRVFLIEI